MASSNLCNYDETQRRYRALQIETEIRHFGLAAGVHVHSGPISVLPLPRAWPSENLARESFAAQRGSRRLGERSELIAWLPYVKSLQLEQVRAWLILNPADAFMTDSLLPRTTRKELATILVT